MHKVMHKAVIALTLALPLGLCACASHEAATPLPSQAGAPAAATYVPAATNPENAVGVLGVWGLVESTKPIATDAIYLSVRRDSQTDARLMRVSGYSGVNYYTATASIDATENRFVVLSRLGSTSAYGSEEQVTAEQHFLGALDRVVSFQLVSNDTLKLSTLTGETMTFKRQGD